MQNYCDLIPRSFILRFPLDTDPGLMRGCVAAWNQRFANHFQGSGFFPGEPEIEGYPGAGPGGGVLRCCAFYLHADGRLWSQLASSRTLTVDEPVRACQVAY